MMEKKQTQGISSFQAVLSSCAGPGRVLGLHCRPQSSTSISCSWTPPEADFDSYNIECVHQDSRTVVYSRRTGKDSTSYVITQLDPHRHYTVYVKVISAGTTSSEVEDSIVTMIDRKRCWIIMNHLSARQEVNILFALPLQVLPHSPLVPGSVRGPLLFPHAPSCFRLTAAGSVIPMALSSSLLWWWQSLRVSGLDCGGPSVEEILWNESEKMSGSSSDASVADQVIRSQKVHFRKKE